MSRPWSKPVLIVTAVVGCALIGGGGVLIARSLHHDPLITSDIQSAVTFPILVPNQKSDPTYPVLSVHYDSSLGRLTYTTAISGISVDVSEQATPEAFTDVPQAYDKLTSSLQEYKTFASPQGTVSLTHPKELNGGQSAVMNAKGVLLFAKPARALDDASWQRLFSKLVIYN